MPNVLLRGALVALMLMPGGAWALDLTGKWHFKGALTAP